MKIVILTALTHDLASRVLPALCDDAELNVGGVVLVHGGSADRGRFVRTKLRKIAKIGLLGAMNGVRLRAWYADHEARDIRAVCAAHQVPLWETSFLNSDETRDLFRHAGADLGLSLGNGYIGRSVYSIPRRGMVNVHTEVLPDFQGAQSIIWAIYEGRKDTGFTIHQIDERIDTGDILYQEKYPMAFERTLRETVETNMRETRKRVPSAVAYVCRNYEALRSRSIKQGEGRRYTTPTIWQYVRIVLSHRRMYSGGPGKRSQGGSYG